MHLGWAPGISPSLPWFVYSDCWALESELYRFEHREPKEMRPPVPDFWGLDFSHVSSGMTRWEGVACCHRQALNCRISSSQNLFLRTFSAAQLCPAGLLWSFGAL